jgi:hypothetical protein
MTTLATLLQLHRPHGWNKLGMLTLSDVKLGGTMRRCRLILNLRLGPCSAEHEQMRQWTDAKKRK